MIESNVVIEMQSRIKIEENMNVWKVGGFGSLSPKAFHIIKRIMVSITQVKSQANLRVRNGMYYMYVPLEGLVN